MIYFTGNLFSNHLIFTKFHLFHKLKILLHGQRLSFHKMYLFCGSWEMCKGAMTWSHFTDTNYFTCRTCHMHVYVVYVLIVFALPNSSPHAGLLPLWSSKYFIFTMAWVFLLLYYIINFAGFNLNSWEKTKFEKHIVSSSVSNCSTRKLTP